MAGLVVISRTNKGSRFSLSSFHLFLRLLCFVCWKYLAGTTFRDINRNEEDGRKEEQKSKGKWK